MKKEEKNSNNEAKPSKYKNKSLLISIPISLLLITGLYFYITPMNKESPVLSSNQFTFKSIKNRIFHIKTIPDYIKIKELTGKIVFLKVFGWDCQYCKKEIPELVQLKKKFKGAFETISIEEQHHSHQEHLGFIEKYHINYNIINGDEQKEFLNYLKVNYNWNGVIPLTIVLDAQGKILAFEVGYKSYSLTKLLQTTLEQLTQVVKSRENIESSGMLHK
jgi:thiol-disulfide isomerase/thioredoxin